MIGNHACINAIGVQPVLKMDAISSQSIQELYELMLSLSSALPNGEFFARVISSWRFGSGVLPDALGLTHEEFRDLASRYFGEIRLNGDAPSGIGSDPARAEEIGYLIELLLANRAGNDDSETIVAKIIAQACTGNDHLWQDLGLCSRNDLSAVMENNFPSLFIKNTKNMKWKKFLYKQLCEMEGIRLCRAPSCEVCADYERCFGPEE